MDRWVHCIERDITESKAREEELRRSLGKKELLLAEVHHRVKNNLAVVSIPLKLEHYQQLHSEEINDVLRKAELRIKPIATIHKNLYNTANFFDITSDGYIDDIVKSCRRTIPRPRGGHRKEGGGFSLNVHQAVPFGLIISELLNNIYKHAFDGSKTCRASITVTEKKNPVTLTVGDNGDGLPEKTLYEDGGSLGVTIIKTLVRQLEGTAEVLDGPGLTFRLQFGKNDKKGSASAVDSARGK